MKRKPTRRDLLIVISRLQDVIGKSTAAHGNDRDPNGFEEGMKALDEAFRLCIEASSQDDPVSQDGPWGSER